MSQHTSHPGADHSDDLGPMSDTAEQRMAGLPRSILRRRHPDGIRAWAVFQPNAPGSGELVGIAALRRRQLLKMQEQYYSERLLIVVGRDAVAAWVTFGRQLVLRCVGQWSLDALLAFQVAAVGPRDPLWPAFVLWDLGRLHPLAELRAVRDDEQSRRVFDLLSAQYDGVPSTWRSYQ